MEGIKLELNDILNNLNNFHSEINEKVHIALQDYLSRASTTQRSPAIIQLNHFIDDVYSVDKNNSCSVVYSPSCMPLPVAAFVNCELINGLSSKLFLFDNQGNIDIHVLEYIIPILLALFTVNSVTDEFTYNGSLFVSSLFLSADIAAELSQTEMSNSKRIYITTVLIVSTLLSLTTESVAYILDKLWPKMDQEFNVRECLELLVICQYPPHSHVYAHQVSIEVRNLMSVFENRFRKQNPPGTVTSIQNMQFCLPDMSPLFSILCAAVSLDICPSKFKRLHLSINSNLTKSLPNFSINLPTSMHDIDNNPRWCVASYLAWCSSNRADLLRWVLVDFDNATVKAIYNKITISIEINQPCLIEMDVLHDDDKSCERHIVMDHVHLMTALNKMTSAVKDNILFNLQANVGVDSSKILLRNIDGLLSQSSIKDALSFVFERPALD